MMSASLIKAIRYLLFFILLFTALYFAKPFLVPVAFGALFSMLLLPVSEKMEKKMGRVPSILVCIVGILLLVAGIFALISWQVADIASDASKMEKQITQMLHQARQQLSTTLGIPPEKQEQLIKGQQQGSSNMGAKVAAIFSGIMGVLANALLVLVYIFLFLYTRNRLKNFVLKLVPVDKQTEAKKIITDSRKVAQQYLSGMGMMIVCLWILYSIGFTIAGVENAVFFAILCGLLEIVPFVGNLTGTGITALMALTQGGGTTVLIGVLVTYAIVQMFQSYVLEPLVVGSKVNINPLFTILILIIGELVWGIAGMVLAIPLLGIFKIICDHVEPLKPYGYLIGEDKKENDSKWIEKIKNLFQKSR
ncbi:MAG TPA: AI-2E family transporter [Flavipsychrobacter sp.]|nr:AI-2E family transporter [Flavipsychrobacter sp.]